jgi:integrase
MLFTATAYPVLSRGGYVMKTKLTPAFVLRATAEPGADRSIYWDASMAGFGLLLTATGHKSYVVQYRANGASRRVTLDSVLSLDEARKKARGILGEVAKGGDPVAAERAARAAQENSLSKVAARYFASRAARNLRSSGERLRILERLVLPKLGDRQIETIKRSEVARLLEHIADKSGPRMAGYTAAVLSILFHWFEKQSDDFVSPMVKGMAGPDGASKPRDRVLNDLELMAFWRAAQAWQEHPFPRLLQFILLTATRRDEAAAMLRSELAGDVWIIPAARYKTKIAHSVPLSRAAQDVIAGCPVLGSAGFMFSLTGRKGLRGFARLKSQFDARMLAELRKIDPDAELANWVTHDLRRTARTLMARAAVVPDHAERALGHKLNGVSATYNRHAYEAEKLAAFEALSAQIDRIVDPQPNVVPLERAKLPA